MSALVAEIEAKIRSLSQEDRVTLIRALIGELDGPADADVEEAWLVEARRRRAELASGQVQGVAGHQVFENLYKRLRR
jgi:putative addiction module component (TIGR02574 family)